MSDSKEIVNYDEMLAAMSKAAVAQEKPTASSIGLRAGQLTYNGSPIPGNKLDCIILASTHANLFYQGKYDPDNLSSPVCYAYGDTEEEMEPHPSSSQPQAENCAACPHNKFGSADNGKGKRCKNSRSLALIPADTKAEDLATAEVAVIKLPVTSGKNWSQYVNKIATLYQRPPLGVISQIGTVPDAKSQFKVTFGQGELVGNELLGGLIAKMPSAQELLRKVYEANEEDDLPMAQPAKGGKFK
jgi:hypothetical protein